MYWTALARLRMLSNMRYLLWGRIRWSVVLCASVASGHFALWGQNCTTQSRMTAQQRAEIGSTAYQLASAVLAGNAAQIRSSTIARFASDFAQTAYLVESTSARITGDTLAVTQAYLLDASERKVGDTAAAEFACPLAGTVSETDFGIPGLPPGRFAFAMVEARGTHPWLLSFLLEQENGTWKMAGFYPHERAAAGHDGLWYWTTARADAKADRPWLAWMLYDEADRLLRPAPFVSTGNLDKLRGEQRAAAPELLSNGLSVQTPLSVEGANGARFQVTRLEAQSSEDATALNLILHLQGDAGVSSEQKTARSVAAATALLSAHPELRQGFTNVWIVTDTPGANPFVVQKPMTEIVAVNR